MNAQLATPDTDATISAWTGCDSTSTDKTQCMIKVTEDKKVKVEFTGGIVRTIKDDFNGDNNSDVLWQNTTTGDVAAWLMGNGLTITSANYIARGIPNKWQIKSAEDSNGDGMADIIWHNITSGDVYMRLMDGLSVVDGGLVTTGLSNDWQLK